MLNHFMRFLYEENLSHFSEFRFEKIRIIKDDVGHIVNGCCSNVARFWDLVCEIDLAQTIQY